MIQHIDHINIVVSDLERSSSFFQAIGFRIQHQGDLEGEWISMIVGLEDVKARFVSLELPGAPTRLELIKYHNPGSPNDPEIGLANKIGFRHMAFRVTDIDRVIRSLKDLGVELLSEVQRYEPTQKSLVYFYGPDGILLELCQYGE